ncbi:MAG: L-idonate 5-dehydrogenase [Rhodomicrobiaceae bacterium]
MSSTTNAIIASAARKLGIGPVPVPAVGPDEVKIAVRVGGICGSDLHYYLHGGFGTVRLKAPMVLGHELSGEIVETGAAVSQLRAGQRVAVNPSLACGSCSYCRSGHANHCVDMRFFGSAMRTPHVDGGFRDVLVCKAVQAVPIADHLSFADAALAEPFAVCLHAAGQAGELAGKRVLVTGAGPIGVLIAASAGIAGAAEIVVTDILPQPLEIASAMGATRTINTGTEKDALASECDAHGLFDVHFEASGHAQAFAQGLASLKRMGIMVLVGNGGETALPISSVMAREIQLRGSFRFHREFNTAIAHLEAGKLDARPLITATLPASDPVPAFDLAADKARSMKVHLAFGEN